MFQNWKDPETPIKWTIGALLLVVLLISFILILTRAYISRVKSELNLKAKNKIKHKEELLKNSIDIQERERTRIASDIHDELIAQLYRIKLTNNDQNIDTFLKETINTARKISHDLFPPLLEENKLIDLFESFLTPIYEKMDIDFYYSGKNVDALQKEMKIHIYRIFQEIITNIIKHSKSIKITIQIRVTEKYFSLLIKDEGIGISDDMTNGLGMKNIELRAQQIKASFRFLSNKPKGTKFLLIHTK
ncbi:MAG: hypothetical protein JXQ93_04400 [Flavobacteriaceae bacterium]